MKKIRTLICLWSLASLLATEIHAQLWGPQAGGVVYKISPNGRYVTGMTQASNGSGFVWDTQSNVFETLGQTVYPHGITDDKMIVANNRYREPGASEWTGLGDGVWLWQVTSDGQTVAGHLEDATGATAPYSWSRNATGGWTAKEWTHPDGIRQGAIYDISDDGQTAVGYVHISNRVAILWRSPDSAYELPFSTGAYSEYFCVSANGKYVGFAYNTGNDLAWAGVRNLETNEITYIKEGFRVNAVDNNGFAFGAYNANNIDRAFIWNKKLGFMDFGDFISTYASEEELETIRPSSLWRALTNKSITYSINSVTPDGWTFALCLQGSMEVYVLKIAPVTVYPFPRNLSVDVPPADRNRVILTWDAPELDGENLTGYAIYRRGDSLATVGANVLTYTDDNISTPGYYNYQVTALYGDKHSNFSNTAQAAIINDYNLPLRENFDKLNLTANYWTTETSRETSLMNWHVYDDVGVDGTGLLLTVNNMFSSHNQDFSASLISKYLDGRNASGLFLSFLVKPEYYLETGLTPDTLLIDVHDGEEWKTVDKYVFQLSMEWKADIVDLSEAATGKIFRVRFRVTGVNRTVSAKYIHFDDIVVATSPPAGNAKPKNVLADKTGDSVRIAWQNPHTNQYVLTYANSTARSAVGNESKSFIAVNHFDPADVNMYKDKYLTSISAYINKKVSSPKVDTQLKLAVFIDGQRVVNKEITAFTPNAWNTFPLDNSIALEGKDLKFGIEVAAHDSMERPIGVDDARRPVSGKGDLYSEDGGQTWKTLTEAGIIRNWIIAGNVSNDETIATVPATDIVGYNIYACGVKLNDDLVFGQSFVTDVSCESYTIRAYSLATGLSAESESAINVGIVPFPKTQLLPEIYPNPVKDILFIRSETPVENLTVYDLTGRICKQAGAGETTLFVGDLTSGVYVVGIKTAAGEYAEKIYIKKIE